MYPWMEELLALEQKNANELRQLEKLVRHAPEGHLKVSQTQAVPRYYVRDSGSERHSHYLKVKDLNKAKTLANKRYNMEAQKLLFKQQNAIHAFVKNFPDQTLQDLYDSYPEVWRALITPREQPFEEYAAEWKAKMEEHASHEDFKSKSEFIFHQTYDNNGLVHVYEPRLFLEGYGFIYPDFAVLHPITRETIYHEHFGMVTKDKYEDTMFKKFIDYQNNGYVLGKNLIATFESGDQQLKPERAESLVLPYFLKKPLS